MANLSYKGVRNLTLGLALASLAVLPTAVSAGNSTGTLTSTASIAKNCTVGNGSMAFGAYDPVSTNLTANLDQTATMTVTCTKASTGITLGMGASANNANCPGGGATARCMKDGSNASYLNYQLYSDSGRTTVWTTAITETVTGGVGSPTTVTIYGRVPGAQDAAVGTGYTDAITATVNY